MTYAPPPDNVRASIPKRVRFEVFKRDSFTCQYCGRAAPGVVLNVDHIHPVADGGGADILNLITACFDCNSGKGARRLSDHSAVTKQRTQLVALNDRREQLEMMLAWRAELAALDEKKVDAFNVEFEKATGCHLNETGRETVRRWLKKHELDALFAGMEGAVATYYKGGSDDPAENCILAAKAFDRIIAVVRGQARYADKPHMHELFYIRGIIRNRFAYCNEPMAIRLLASAYDAGIPTDRLKELAFAHNGWTPWRENIESWIAEGSAP